MSDVNTDVNGDSEKSHENPDVVSEISEVPEVPLKKKRGRKPKADKKPQQPSDGPRRRGRRKKYQIASIKKFREDDKTDDKIIFSGNDQVENVEHLEQEHISFDGLNLTVHKAKSINTDDLRKEFDNKFKMNEIEKAPTVLLQEKRKKKEQFDDWIEEEEEEEDNIITTNEGFFSKPISPETKEDNDVIMKRVGRKKIYQVLNNVISNIKDTKDWPESTATLCWWCCHSFDTVPIPCPVNYDELRDRFDVKGLFCSWGCAGAYSEENYKSLLYLHMFKQKVCGGGLVKCAPNKICLKSFGGHMTIHAFRKSSQENSDFKIKISTDHISYINQEILEMYTETTTRRRKKK